MRLASTLTHFFAATLLPVTIHAGLIETGSQCQLDNGSTTATSQNLRASTPSPIQQWVYTPSSDTLSFAAFCTGANVKPKIQRHRYDGGLRELGFKDRFRFDDCGYVTLNSCCIVDPTGPDIEDKPACTFNEIIVAHCRANVSPEDKLLMTCPSGSLLEIVSSTEFVLQEMETGQYVIPYMANYGSEDDRTVVTQPDKSVRVTPHIGAMVVAAISSPQGFLTVAQEVCNCYESIPLLNQCVANMDSASCPEVELPEVVVPPPPPPPVDDTDPLPDNKPVEQQQERPSPDGYCNGWPLSDIEEICGALNIICNGNCMDIDNGCLAGYDPVNGCTSGCAALPCSSFFNDADCTNYGCTWNYYPTDSYVPPSSGDGDNTEQQANAGNEDNTEQQTNAGNEDNTEQQTNAGNEDTEQPSIPERRSAAKRINLFWLIIGTVGSTVWIDLLW